MSYDIYGEPLRRGHCEVHPHVHDEYPCSVCVAESRRQQEAQSPAQCSGHPAYCESAHYLGQAQAEIKRLNDEIQALRKDAELFQFILEEAWFQRAFDRFDPDDNGNQSKFESECRRILRAAMEKQK